jgi:hypothetical protein
MEEMMPEPDAAKAEWVGRVLGVALSRSQAGMKARGPLLPIWTEAKEKADSGITKLQNALRERKDEDLDAIAEYGLYGATTGQSVTLMAALREADATGAPEAYEKVCDAVEDFRDFLEGAPIVDLIEGNPFGVSVPLRATLGPALAELEKRAAG